MSFDTSMFKGITVAFNACYDKYGNVDLDSVKKQQTGIGK